MDLHEVANEQRDVFPTFPERRHDDRHHIEPVVEIFAKHALINFFEQILIGRG